MNKLEETLQNVEYSTDWYELRNNLLAAIGSFIDSTDCEWVQVWEKELEKTKLHSIVFLIYGSLYIWTDFVENGLIEGYIFERPINDNVSTVLYANTENSTPIAPIIFKLIDDGEMKRIK